MSAADVSLEQVRGLAADHFCWLLLRASFVARAPAVPGRLLVTTSEAVWRAASARNELVFVGGELHALAVAAENDRATSVQLAAWCRRKRAQSWWRLDVREALGGLRDVRGPQWWPVERVLRAYGAELVSVATGDEVPA